MTVEKGTLKTKVSSTASRGGGGAKFQEQAEADSVGEQFQLLWPLRCRPGGEQSESLPTVETR